MSGPSGLRESIVAARRRIADARAALQLRHEAGEDGPVICHNWADALDVAIHELFEEVLEDHVELGHGRWQSKVALVALGGYGRKDVAPYSDLDLLLLHDPTVGPDVATLAKRLAADASDLGVQSSLSVRTLREACQLAWKDLLIFTSQAEARFLAGSVTLYKALLREFRAGATKRATSLVNQIEKARGDERAQYGETVFLLEPNIKRSRGGLRDVHVLRWVGFTRYGQPDPAGLEQLGLLNTEDGNALRAGYAFLLRLRNELHFHAGRSQDVLRRLDQPRVAHAWHYQESETALAVEHFMRDYFAHTNGVRHAVNHFIANTRGRSLVETMMMQFNTHRFDQHFLVGPMYISVTRKGLSQLLGNPEEILRLMERANIADRRIAQETWYAIRDDMAHRGDIAITPAAAKRFLALLSHSARLGPLLRLLHEVRVLEKLVVGLDHARHLVQFNEYHKYTVDEHSIMAVERATEFEKDTGPLGAAYRSLKDDRWLLHLAILIHDLGKGFTEDHSEVGRRLALETAARLELTPADTDFLAFLVEKHLVMPHLAFRRDISDVGVIVRFAAEVGSPEYLRALYLLSVADLAAVGPEVLTPWKLDVLTDLYLRTHSYLAGTQEHMEERAHGVRRAVLAKTPAEDAVWYEVQVKSLPDTYLLESSVEVVVEDLNWLRELTRAPVLAWGRFSSERGIAVYSLGFRAGRARGTFHR
ncbi:MAG TPA: HD domain-containing protein, partial [Pirellulaceae bacterium]